jgi:hypothetical protein
MKSNRKIQHHPGQENKTGKATYASTTGTNSSTIQSAVEGYKAETSATGKLLADERSKRPLRKISKQ